MADPNLPTWENAKNIIASTTSSTYFSKPKNLACRNLCNKVPPKNFQILLGLRLNYALKTPRVKNNTKTIMKRFRNDIDENTSSNKDQKIKKRKTTYQNST